jgi:hypothetical protein
LFLLRNGLVEGEVGVSHNLLGIIENRGVIIHIVRRSYELCLTLSFKQVLSVQLIVLPEQLDFGILLFIDLVHHSVEDTLLSDLQCLMLSQ